MPRVRFVDAAGRLLAEVDAMAGDNLLDVARLAEVPLHWRCGQGTCGTCRVQVALAQPSAPRPGRKERNVLLRAGAIEQALAGSEQWPLAASHWRLACHLQLDDADWQVSCPAF